MSDSSFRRDWISKPIFGWAKHVLPSLSDTEREAIEAGDVWWDADLFSGNPDWAKLLAFPPAALSVEEQAFLDGPVDELCGMLDDWHINWELHDLPPEVWDFLKRHKFFAMIIPKSYGGLGFSAYAHSEVIRKLSTRSLTGAVTSMVDSGVVCRGTWQGRDLLGIKLNLHKRYITLGPIATVLGLAFKLYDPDHLIGTRDDIGITVALVPTNLPGVEIGRRHLPAMQVFQNGP